MEVRQKACRTITPWACMKIDGSTGASQLGGRHGLILMAHKAIRTTKIYTHILYRDGRGVRSPAAGLTRWPDER